jgi:TolB-like protein/DNA-binding winged helix-turn-helix (wHTH) protein/Flp pilus assembly protein TadD
MDRSVYEFDRFRLDPIRRVLCDRGTGQSIPLAARGLDALIYLVEHRGELIDKATLLEALWPGLVVEENNLNQSITAIRRALGERAGDNRFVINVTGRGYRFVAEVAVVSATPTEHAVPDPEPVQTELPATPVPVPDPPTPRPRRRLSIVLAALFGTTLIIAVIAINRRLPDNTSIAGRSVAVMPFANMSGDAGNEYLGDGIAEEVIHLLTRDHRLRVPARTSSFAYKGRAVDVRQIARDLDVEFVLEGSVRMSDDRLRVTAQLVDGSTGFHKWSKSYDRRMSELFALQEDLAGTIASALAGDSASAPVAGNPPTHDVEAWALQTQADALVFRRPTPANVERATSLLERAVERDPKFARAWSALAFAQLLGLVWYDVPHDIAVIEAHARRAVSLDTSSGGAHSVLSMVLSHRGDFVQAHSHWQRSIERNGDDAAILARAADLLIRTGRIQQALHYTRRAHELAPGDPEIALRLASAALVAGADAEAREQIEFATSVGWQRDVPPLGNLLWTLHWRAGTLASAEGQEILRLHPYARAAGGHEVVMLALAAQSGTDRRAEAVAALRRLHERISEAEKGGTRWFTIQWLTVLGALDDAYAIAALEAARVGQKGVIGSFASGVVWTPEMASFRRDARFVKFAAELGLVKHWQEFGAPDYCAPNAGEFRCR